MNRDLDGLYFRIGSQNICWSDLTETQMNEMLEGRNERWLKNMCIILGKTLKSIGDQFDIYGGCNE